MQYAGLGSACTPRDGHKRSPSKFKGSSATGSCQSSRGSSELLIFPKVFSMQQQPQQLSFQGDAFHGLFGHKIMSIGATVLLCLESGVELVV